MNRLQCRAKRIPAALTAHATLPIGVSRSASFNSARAFDPARSCRPDHAQFLDDPLTDTTFDGSDNAGGHKRQLRRPCGGRGAHRENPVGERHRTRVLGHRRPNQFIPASHHCAGRNVHAPTAFIEKMTHVATQQLRVAATGGLARRRTGRLTRRKFRASSGTRPRTQAHLGCLALRSDQSCSRCQRWVVHQPGTRCGRPGCLRRGLRRFGVTAVPRRCVRI